MKSTKSNLIINTSDIVFLAIYAFLFKWELHHNNSWYILILTVVLSFGIWKVFRFICIAGIIKWLTIKKPMKQFLNKEFVQECEGFLFGNLYSEIKEANLEVNQKLETKLKKTFYKLKITISYNWWANEIIILTKAITDNVNSAASNSEFCHWKRINKNKFEFEFKFNFSRDIANSRKLKDDITNYHDFYGHAKLVIENNEILSYTYTSDFIDRFSFGHNKNKVKES